MEMKYEGDAPPAYRESAAHATDDPFDDDAIGRLESELKALKESVEASRDELKTLRDDSTRPDPEGGSPLNRGFFNPTYKLSERTVRQLEDASEEVELEASMWDSAVFVGTSVAGRGASVLMVILVLFNICLQGFFAFIISSLGDDSPITDGDVDQLRWWRRNVGQSAKYYNAAKGETMARRVCDGDFGVEASGVQAELHQTLNDYLGDYGHKNAHDNSSKGPGISLCMLAVSLWIMTVFVDARGALDTLTALWVLPRGRRSEVRLTHDGQIVIEKLSRKRFVFVAFIQLIRLVIGAILIWNGSLYLAHTIDVGELILNAIALEFVLRVDELIYACFAPMRIRMLVKHCKAMSAPRFRACSGVDVRSILAFIACFGLALGIYLGPVLEQEKILEKAQHAMCGGDLDFVFAVDAVGVPWWSPTPKADESLEEFNFPNGETRRTLKREDVNRPYIFDDKGDGGETNVDRYVNVLLKQYGRPYFLRNCDYSLCDNTTLGKQYPQQSDKAAACCHARATKLTDASAVLNVQQATFQEVIEAENPTGLDILNSPFAGLTKNWRLGLADTVNKEPCGGCGYDKPLCDHATRTCVEVNCEAVRVYCGEANATGRLTRGFCPQLCGCNHPLSPLALALPFWGCGSVDTAGGYQQYMNEVPCEDASPEPKSESAIAYDKFLRREFNETRWSLFHFFLDNADTSAYALPLEANKAAVWDIRFLRRFGCQYLSDPTLWHSFNSTWDALFFDSLTKPDLVKPAYFLGRNLCVRGGNPFKPLSLFCPEACGCYRGDRDCPLECPTRVAADNVCPDYQQQILPKDWGWECAQRPKAQAFNAGIRVKPILPVAGPSGIGGLN
mmetsp:Transcript_866/g.2638  ORF Transcript_866/g.2638 Transcript_866/m.2638 type:complete len:847 (-) Transcript_866:23-2563(-)